MQKPQPIASKCNDITMLSELSSNLLKTAERIEKELAPPPTGVNQWAMDQKHYDQLMQMRDILDGFDVMVEDMDSDAEIINELLGTINMHISCARDAIDTINSVILGE